MPALVAPGVAEVKLYYTDGQSKAMNVFHVHRETGGWDNVSLADLLGIFTTWFTDHGDNITSHDTQLYRLTAVDLTSLDSARVDMPLEAPLLGGLVTAGLPYNVTLAVKMDTHRRGRGRAGRVFVCGLSEAAVDLSDVDSAYAAQVITEYQALLDALNAAPDIGLVVLHKYRDGMLLDPPTYDSVQAFSLTDRTVDSKRTRLPGHKRHKRSNPLTA